jgi:hypothetical protein
MLGVWIDPVTAQLMITFSARLMRQVPSSSGRRMPANGTLAYELHR